MKLANHLQKPPKHHHFLFCFALGRFLSYVMIKEDKSQLTVISAPHFHTYFTQRPQVGTSVCLSLLSVELFHFQRRARKIWWLDLHTVDWWVWFSFLHYFFEVFFSLFSAAGFFVDCLLFSCRLEKEKTLYHIIITIDITYFLFSWRRGDIFFPISFLIVGFHHT